MNRLKREFSVKITIQGLSIQQQIFIVWPYHLGQHAETRSLDAGGKHIRIEAQ